MKTVSQRSGVFIVTRSGEAFVDGARNSLADAVVTIVHENEVAVVEGEGWALFFTVGVVFRFFDVVVLGEGG